MRDIAYQCEITHNRADETSHLDAVYVLHAFQKKTQKTSLQDIDIARKRYRLIG